jgi:aminoglycoside phosphotransferase (APT) family kinase protein
LPHDPAVGEAGPVSAGSLPLDEVDPDPDLVRRLLTGQFPHWAGLPLQRVASPVTDTALYRLGTGFSVRLPRIGWAIPQIEREHEWLPRLAPLLPVAVPELLAVGGPAEGYPWHWAIYSWLDGDNPVAGHLEDAYSLASDLATFLRALRLVPSEGGPPAGRGGSLRDRDDATREAIGASRGLIPTRAIAAATAAWEAAASAPEWAGAPAWLHGDLAAANLLTRAGRLAAVVNWGSLGTGDPAVDLGVAWNLLPAEVRDTFRIMVDADGATWRRAQGWALTVALLQLPYFHATDAALARAARRVIREILAEHGDI